jgi:hypothetical protein
MSSDRGTITHTYDGFAVYYPNDTVRQQQQHDLDPNNFFADFTSTHVIAAKKTVETKVATVEKPPVAPINRDVFIVAGISSFITFLIYTLVLIACFKLIVQVLKKLASPVFHQSE